MSMRTNSSIMGHATCCFDYIYMQGTWDRGAGYVLLPESDVAVYDPHRITLPSKNLVVFVVMGLVGSLVTLAGGTISTMSPWPVCPLW